MRATTTAPIAATIMGMRIHPITRIMTNTPMGTLAAAATTITGIRTIMAISTIMGTADTIMAIMGTVMPIRTITDAEGAGWLG